MVDIQFEFGEDPAILSKVIVQTRRIPHTDGRTGWDSISPNRPCRLVGDINKKNAWHLVE